MIPPTPLEAASATSARAAARGRLAGTVVAGTLSRAAARLETAAASCRGPRHAANEDSHSSLVRQAPVYVVADGVGGGAMAARASGELVHTLHRLLDDVAPIDAALVGRALLVADREVARCIASETEQAGAATVALCTSPDAALARWIVAWVGDCRVHRVRAGDAPAEPVTRDDSYRNLAELPPAGGSLDDPARMIGNGAVAEPNVLELTLDHDDMLVLSSDGVHRYVPVQAIATLLRDDRVPLPRRCMRLLSLARLRGSTDDATVLVVHRSSSTVRPDAQPAPDEPSGNKR